MPDSREVALSSFFKRMNASIQFYRREEWSIYKPDEEARMVINRTADEMLEMADQLDELTEAYSTPPSSEQEEDVRRLLEEDRRRDNTLRACLTKFRERMEDRRLPWYVRDIIEREFALLNKEHVFET